MTLSLKKTTVFLILLAIAMFMGTVSAYAYSNETTTTVPVTFTKLAGKQVVFPAGTSRGDIATTLATTIGRRSVYPTDFIINVGGIKYTVQRADMNAMMPATINYGIMADMAVRATANPTIVTPGQYMALVRTSGHNQSVSALANKIAKLYSVPAKNMKYAMSKKNNFIIVNSSTGYTVSSAKLYAAITAEITRWAENGYVGPMRASAARTVTAAGASTRSQLGKAIKVDRSQRMLYLYNKGKVVAKYRVAIGMRGYSTPVGVYKIGAKRARPTWGNPGSKWARNMPRFIKPGPTNPLGLRAMNLNKNGRDTGLRIHGTSNTRSLGTASSHGCVRVANKNIVKLFKLVPSGTPVYIQQ